MEWKEVLLGELVDIYDSKRIPLTSQEREKIKGDIPYYGAQGIIDYINQFLFDGEYILIAEDGNNIKSRQENIAQIAKGKFWVNNHAHILQGKIEQNLLCYIINHTDISGYVTGSAQPKLNQANLLKIPIKIPVNLSDQRKIAGILSALDSKIENNNKINANLEAQAQALFKSWFVDFTPFKDQPFVDSELGPIPQGWKVGTLGDIANIIMGQSPAGSSYNERGNGVIFYQGRTEFGFRFPNVRLYTTMPKRYAEPMSILLSVRAPVGDINVAIEKCCIGRGLASISSKRGLHSFLLYLVKSLKNRLEVFNGEGTVFGSINKNTLMQFKIIIPPIEMQEKFNEIIQRHDCMVLELHKEIINLSTQRDTLLPKLMSGEIKL